MAEAAAKNRSGGSLADSLKLPPHSVEAEQSLLGGVMLDPSSWDQIADVVSVEDFYRADHKLIFKAINALNERDQPPDALTVSEHLERQGELAAAGGLAYLSQLVRDVPSVANVRAYAGIVRDRSVLRQLIGVGNAIAASAYDDEGLPVDELVDLAERKVFDIADRGKRRGRGFKPLKDLTSKTIDRIDQLYHSTADITGIAMSSWPSTSSPARPRSGSTGYPRPSSRVAPGSPA